MVMSTKTKNSVKVDEKKKKEGRGGKRTKKPWVASLVYKYGARRPVECYDEVCEQLAQAHFYRNKTVELEHERRVCVDADLLALPGSGKLRRIESQIKTKVAARGKLRDQLKLLHVQKRSKKARDPKVEAQIKALTSEINALYVVRKEERSRLFKTEEWKAGEERRKEEFGEKNRQHYNAAPGMSGTRGRIKREATKLRRGPPPHFKRWDGQDKISYQFSDGITLEEVMSGDDKRFRLVKVDGGIWEKGTAKARGKPPVDLSKIKTPDGRPHGMRLDEDGYPMRKLGNAWVLLRIHARDKKGKLRRGGHTPVWTKFPINYHRDLPENCVIKEVFLQRRKIGPDERWYFQVLLDEDTRKKAPDPRFATSGYVAIDVGWRLVPDDEKPCGFKSKDHDELQHATACPKKALRVVKWLGSDGRKGEIVLPARMLDAFLKVYDIQSIRKRKFNDMRSKLYGWMNPPKKGGGKKEREKRKGLPAWLWKRVKHMHAWHKAVRLVKVFFEWEKNRFAGDSAIFDALREWRVDDKHLFTYEAHLRDQTQNQRNTFYRQVISKLRQRYAVAFIEDIDLSILQKRKEPEEAHLEKEATRYYRKIACISKFREYLGERFQAVKVNPAGTSYICHNCGSPSFVGSAAIVHECSVCGNVCDRDDNACLHIMDRGLAILCKSRGRRSTA